MNTILNKPSTEKPQVLDYEFLIVSLKHTSRKHEHITFWGPGHRGYTQVVGDHMGKYTLEEARRLNDGIDYIAVQADVLECITSGQPYYAHNGVARRFYEQDGEVVLNLMENWHVLLDARLDGPTNSDGKRVKPDWFRGKCRSFNLSAGGRQWPQ